MNTSVGMEYAAKMGQEDRDKRMNTSLGGVGTSAISPPTSIMIYINNATLVTIRPNGVIEYGPDYTPDAAAKAFWEALGDSMPADRKLVGELKAELAEQCRLHAMGSEREARLMARVAELERDAARWRKVEAMMVHQRCGPNFGWTIDALLAGDSPTDAIDAARGTE